MEKKKSHTAKSDKFSLNVWIPAVSSIKFLMKTRI